RRGRCAEPQRRLFLVGAIPVSSLTSKTEMPSASARTTPETARAYLFTSESVTEGHPDKIADQTSDGVLDAPIGQDPTSRVACEVLVTTGLAFVAGEISSKGYVEI